MSYALAAPLQAAVFSRLKADPVLGELIGDALYDALPHGALPETYVTLGDEDVKDRSDQSGQGAWHDFSIRIVSEGAGYRTAKLVAGAVSDALTSGDLPDLEGGRLVGLWFLRARARRIATNDKRQIELRFRARVEDDD